MAGFVTINDDIVFSLKKHYCPHCKMKLKTKKVSRVFALDDPEVRNYLKRVTHIYGKTVTIQWKDYICPICNRQFTVNEIEAKEREEKPITKKQLFMYNLIVTLIIVLVVIVFLFFWISFILLRLGVISLP